MGVYIKGMKKPEKCLACPMLNYEDWCVLQEWTPEKDYTNYTWEGMRKNCPLIEVKEPHGDLIDRDILEQELSNGIKAGNCEEGYEHYANINSMDDCVECVRYADTVIEAEAE